MTDERPHEETLVHQLGRIARALEETADGDFRDRKKLHKVLKRIAAADEKRNALLEADREERRQSWAEAEIRQDARLAAIVRELPDEERT